MDKPIYYRMATGGPNQDFCTVIAQVFSQEMWGARSRVGDLFPTVRAYTGHLPDGHDGIEFTTDVTPYVGSAPGQTYWKKVDGCDSRIKEVDDDFIKIPIKVLKVRYSSSTNLKPRTEWVLE